MLPYVTDTFNVLDRAMANNKKVLFEGAQGVLLDIDYGSYPYVTSSSTSMGGIFTGCGIPGGKLDEVLGITKAYTTRVGMGPFPTELLDEVGEKIQKIGNEFGATTGRKRRCGWIDLVLLKYAVKASNITSLALTKLDVLSNIDQLKLCTGYRVNGQLVHDLYPGFDLSAATPNFIEMDPFTDDFQEEGKISKNLELYISQIEGHLKIPVGIMAFGPERREIVFRRDYF